MEKESVETSGKQKPISEYLQEMGTLMTPTGLLFGPLPSLDSSSDFILRWLYTTPDPTEPGVAPIK
jgi:hypothetical protein